MNAPSQHELDRQHWTREVVTFLRGIGLAVTERQAPLQEGETFLPHVLVNQGGLEVVMEEAYPGDVLHEAAHLAIIPAQFRPFANWDLSEAESRMTQYLDEHPMALATYPEDPVARAIVQAADPEATAWQYAAAVHLKVPERWIFPRGSYEGTRIDMLRCLKASSYVGINGLRAAGWTLLRPNPIRPDVPVYPKLKFWLHP